MGPLPGAEHDGTALSYGAPADAGSQRAARSMLDPPTPAGNPPNPRRNKSTFNFEMDFSFSRILGEVRWESRNPLKEGVKFGGSFVLPEGTGFSSCGFSFQGEDWQNGTASLNV